MKRQKLDRSSTNESPHPQFSILDPWYDHQLSTSVIMTSRPQSTTLPLFSSTDKFLFTKLGDENEGSRFLDHLPTSTGCREVAAEENENPSLPDQGDDESQLRNDIVQCNPPPFRSSSPFDVELGTADICNPGPSLLEFDVELFNGTTVGPRSSGFPSEFDVEPFNCTLLFSGDDGSLLGDISVPSPFGSLSPFDVEPFNDISVPEFPLSEFDPPRLSGFPSQEFDVEPFNDDEGSPGNISVPGISRNSTVPFHEFDVEPFIGWVSLDLNDEKRV